MTWTILRSHSKKSIGLIRKYDFIARSSSSQSSSAPVAATKPPESGLKDEWQEFLNSFDPDSIQPHPVDTSSKPEPWKTLLEYPARAAWRVASSVPPPPFQHAFSKVMEAPPKRYTRKQMKKTHESIMEQHHQLALRRDRERQRIVRGYNVDRNPRQLEKDQGILPVAYGPNEAMANLYFRSFSHFTIVQRVLREAQSLLYHQPFPLKIQRVYDFGIGCGSSSAAALHVFPHSIEWIHGIDPSFTMRDVAKLFLQEFSQYTPPPSTDATNTPPVGRSPPQLTFSAQAESTAATLGTFDLSLLTFTSVELPQTAAILAAAGICWEKLQPGGLFVMVEPGTPDGFSAVRTVRNMLLDCLEVGTECQIIAPCTHQGRCPMDRFQYREKHKSSAVIADRPGDDKKTDVFSDSDDEEDDEEIMFDDDDNDKEEEESDDEQFSLGEEEGEIEESDMGDSVDTIVGTRKGYCSFVQSMPGGQGGGRGEKFSYLVVQKRSANPLSTPFPSRWDDVNLSRLLQDATTKGSSVHTQRSHLLEAIDIEKRFLDSNEDELGLELVRSETIRQSYGRIVRAPKKYRGQVWMDLCVAPGSIVRQQILKRQSPLAPGIYSAARKSRWGGIWPNISNLVK